MSDIAILSAVVGVLWGLVLALAGVIWATLRTSQAAVESKVLALETQNTRQEAELAKIGAQVAAHEQLASMQHDHVSDQFARIDETLRAISEKLDRALGLRSNSPYPQPKGHST